MEQVFVTWRHVGCSKYYFQVVDGRRKRIRRSLYFALIDQHNAVEVGYSDLNVIE